MATANLNEPTSASDGNIPYIGAAENDGTGNTLREAINRINARIKEIYGSQDGSNVVQTPFVDNDNIKDDTISADKLALFDDALAATGGHLIIGDGTDFSNVAMSGDATINYQGLLSLGLNVVGTSQLEDNAVTTAKIYADQVTHDKLEDRYTAKVETNHATGAYSLDWEDGTTWEFTATLTGNIELDFTNFKQGQVIDIYGLTGSFTITLDSDAATSETFNKVGGVDYDGSATNHLQVICLDDGDDAVFNYAIATYESDTTPS